MRRGGGEGEREGKGWRGGKGRRNGWGDEGGRGRRGREGEMREGRGEKGR